VLHRQLNDWSIEQAFDVPQFWDTASNALDWNTDFHDHDALNDYLAPQSYVGGYDLVTPIVVESSNITNVAPTPSHAIDNAHTNILDMVYPGK
jgi:hypothetical protein